MKLKKRIADTLVEVIIAMAAFGIIMSGTFDFMANQTLAMVKMRERDDVDFWAQKWINSGDVNFKGTDIRQYDSSIKEIISITLTPESSSNFEDVEKITITKGSTTLIYNLK